MKNRTCPKCAEVKRAALADLSICNQWQARAFDLEVALRDVQKIAAALPAHHGLVIVDRCRAALAPIEADNAETAKIAQSLNHKEPTNV